MSTITDLQESSSLDGLGVSYTPGLVSYSTSGAAISDKGSSDVFVINPKESRIKSMKKGVHNGARLHEQELKASGKKYQGVFVTLTYAPGVNWEPRHISDCLKGMRGWCDRQGVKFRYVWVAEIQEKRKLKFGEGAGHCVHYHIMIWLPKSLQLPKPDKRGWWPHGMTKTERAIYPVPYLIKYSSKGTQFDFPPGCRLHGCGGLSLVSRLERAWWSLPACIRGMFPDKFDKVRRSKGGGWVVHSTGEWFPALFRIISYFPLTVVRVQV